MDQNNGMPEGQLVLVLDETLVRQLFLALRTIHPQNAEISESRISEPFLGFPGISLSSEATQAKLDRQAIGGRIRGRREQLEMSIEELATASGLSARTVGNWELGHVTPGPKLRRLCAPLSATLDWLRYGEEPAHGNNRSKDHEG